MEFIETHRGTIYPWHCDFNGHMNVQHYLGKFDEATWHLLAKAGIGPAYLREANKGMVAVEQNLKYLREILAGDLIVIQSRFIEAKNKAVIFEHKMYNQREELAAESRNVGVHIDLDDRKARPFPADIQNQLAQLIFSRSTIQPSELAAQLRKPEGATGQEVARQMNKGNRFINELVFEQLELKNRDVVLDLGCGNGQFFTELAVQYPATTFVGVDYSPTMVKEARKITSNYDNVQIEAGEAANIPFSSGHFTKICTVNTIYFWEDPEVVLEEFRRSLRSDGWLGIGMRSRSSVEDLPFIKDGFTLFEPEEVIQLLRKNGWIIHKFIQKPDEQFDAVCIIAKLR